MTDWTWLFADGDIFPIGYLTVAKHLTNVTIAAALIDLPCAQIPAPWLPVPLIVPPGGEPFAIGGLWLLVVEWSHA
jgi:hypothetical protein